MGTARVRRVTVGGCLVLAFALTGCASPTDAIGDALDQGVSATATARIALEQADAGRTLHPTARTTVSDMRREVVDALATVAETDAATDAERGRRAEAIDALESAVDAVNAGLGALDGEASDGLDRLADAEAELRALSREGTP